MPLPLDIFPGFTAVGIVSDAVREAAVQFNAEGLDALTGIPEDSIAWADIGTRVTSGLIEGKIPVRLTSLLGFEPFAGERHYKQATLAAVTVKAAPWNLALEWPIQIQQSGKAELMDMYGLAGQATDIVGHGRALKADLVASIIMAGYGASAKALTIPQPGNANGIALFSDGSTTEEHYANPKSAASSRFVNLYSDVGTFGDYFAQSLVDMTQVPHPSKANMTLGLKVTDVIGPTHMLIPFWQTAIQTLSMQTTSIGGTPLAAATTNAFSMEALQRAGAEKLVGAGGMPWRFWIAPQLDAHPYVVANPGKHMWLSVSTTKKSGSWCELLAPSKDFVPQITMLGDGTEEARKSRMIRLFGDLDAGAAAGLPHFVKKYMET